jgi:hypothetical protein
MFAWATVDVRALVRLARDNWDMSILSTSSVRREGEKICKSREQGLGNSF